MNEHSFSSKIIKKCREKGVEKAWKINDNFAGGVPDAWFLGNKTDIWVEFKWLNSAPKRESTKITPALTPQQLSWLKALYRCNKQTYVIIGMPRMAIILEDPEEWENGVPNWAHVLYTHNELVDHIMELTTE